MSESEEIKGIQDRIRSMEKIFHIIYGGVIVGTPLILAYLGYSSFFQIPREIKKSIPNAVGDYIEKHDPGLLERIQQNEKKIIDLVTITQRLKNEAETDAQSITKIRESSLGISEYEIKFDPVKNDLNISKEGISGGRSPCPSGKKALGGGGEARDKRLTVANSYADTETSWTIEWKNPTMEHIQSQAKVWAICANVP